jgi:hypothetical protein
MGDSNDTAMVVLPDQALTDHLYRDKAPWPRHQSTCNDTSATTLLIIRVQDVLPVLTPFQTDVFGNSSETPSAHWPALYLTAFDCRNGKRVAEHPILSPHNSDRFVFETDLITYTRTFWKKTIAPPPNND